MMHGNIVLLESTGIDTITTALVTAMTSIANSAMSGIASILPVAAPVLGAILVIGIGIKVFRKFSGR